MNTSIDPLTSDANISILMLGLFAICMCLNVCKTQIMTVSLLRLQCTDRMCVLMHRSNFFLSVNSNLFFYSFRGFQGLPTQT